jgi:uncharacterized membrane protein YhhN
MNMANTLLTLLVIASAALDIVAVYYWPPAAEYVLKPLTMILVIIIVARAKKPDEDIYRRAVLLGLCCSLVGDLFLMLPWDLFAAGLLSFLVAHLLYIAGFAYTTGRVASLWYALHFLIYGAAMMWILLPRVGGFMKLPVAIYMAVILVMAWQALNRWVVTRQSGSLIAAAGALLFVASDSALAINRFAEPFRESGLVVLSTYFAAQLLIALSVAAAGREPSRPKERIRSHKDANIGGV